MLVGILSDTHDQVDRATRAGQLLRDAGASVLFHCGDITTPPVVTACCQILPTYFAFGNNDRDREALTHAAHECDGHLATHFVLDLAGKKVACAHGDDKGRVRALLAEGPDYLLLGHSHQRRDERTGATRIINPGALHRAKPKTVALLDLEHDTLRFIELD